MRPVVGRAARQAALGYHHRHYARLAAQHVLGAPQQVREAVPIVRHVQPVHPEAVPQAAHRPADQPVMRLVAAAVGIGAGAHEQQRRDAIRPRQGGQRVDQVAHARVLQQQDGLAARQPGAGGDAQRRPLVGGDDIAEPRIGGDMVDGGAEVGAGHAGIEAVTALVQEAAEQCRRDHRRRLRGRGRSRLIMLYLGNMKMIS
jgi:hypothetical protein